MIQTKKRITWIDMAKGLGMLFVILAHIEVGLIGRWIYTFHIPLFFLLSGYVFSTKNDFHTFIKKKCKSILIPYFCLGIPLMLYTGIERFNTGNFGLKDGISLILEFLIQRRKWTLWFLACLFFLNIFFYIAKMILKTNIKLAILAVITPIAGSVYYSAGGGSLPWNIDICLMAFPFFYVGYLYKENHEIADNYLNSKKLSLVLFLVLGTVNILCGYLSFKISGSVLDMFWSEYGFLPLTYIAAFAGISCVIIFAKHIVIKPVRYIGENSILYFAWHQTIMIPISVKCLSLIRLTINESSGMLYIGIYKILQLMIIVTALTICNYIITHTRLKFILGK